MNLSNAKVALVFDWMTTPGGAEKVNLVLHKMFPEAPIFTSIFDSSRVKGFEKARIQTSFIQNLPFSKTHHQWYLNMMPYAYEQFDLSDYDIVISSSHSCAKGIITKPETLHICYCHTPMRYAWDNWHAYIRDYKMNAIFKSLGKKRLHRLRMWDRLSAERVDHFIANSNTVKRRIEKYYHKHSAVIYPSIKLSNYKIAEKKDDKEKYFLAVGRLTPYKKFDLIIDAFNELKLPLKIVGRGISENELRNRAESNIEFLGRTTDQELQKLYSQCEALIFPQTEDFGLTPLEAMASGRPVIAYKDGGALDTIIENKTGLFFEKQTVASLKDAISEYQANQKNFDPQIIREHAAKFDDTRFKKELLEHIKSKWDKWQRSRSEAK